MSWTIDGLDLLDFSDSDSDSCPDLINVVGDDLLVDLRLLDRTMASDCDNSLDVPGKSYFHYNGVTDFERPVSFRTQQEDPLVALNNRIIEMLNLLAYNFYMDPSIDRQDSAPFDRAENSREIPLIRGGPVSFDRIGRDREIHLYRGVAAPLGEGPHPFEYLPYSKPKWIWLGAESNDYTHAECRSKRPYYKLAAFCRDRVFHHSKRVATKKLVKRILLDLLDFRAIYGQPAVLMAPYNPRHAIITCTCCNY